MTSPVEYVVVWSGRGPLLPDREEQWDTRFARMPSLDLEDDAVPVRVRRKYTRTGRYAGICSRTNPHAKQYAPLKPKQSLMDELGLLQPSGV